MIAALNCFLTFVKMSYHASAVWPPPVAWATTAAMRPLLASLNVCIPMSFARLVTMRMHAFSDKSPPCICATSVAVRTVLKTLISCHCFFEPCSASKPVLPPTAEQSWATSRGVHCSSEWSRMAVTSSVASSVVTCPKVPTLASKDSN